MKIERVTWLIFSLMSGPGCALPSIEIQATDRLTSHGLASLATGRGLKLAGTAGVDGNSTYPLFSDKRFPMKNNLRGGEREGWWQSLRRKIQVLLDIADINQLHPQATRTSDTLLALHCSEDLALLAQAAATSWLLCRRRRLSRLPRSNLYATRRRRCRRPRPRRRHGR